MFLFGRKKDADGAGCGKILFASDIHGSAKYCKELLEAYKRENAARLILLGDILYHGPRNPLPEEYAPKEVAEMLSAYKSEILCVRGNCDSEVDQMVLPFPVLPDYAQVLWGGVNICLSHGHRTVPPLGPSDVYITGHTHVPENTRKDGFLHLNPGSVSLPKDNAQTRGYIIFDGSLFLFKTLDGKIYDKA